jgi:hypothetical protein
LITKIFIVKLQQLKNKKLNSFLRNLHPQKPSLWKVTRYFTTPKQKIPPLLRNGTQIYRSQEKAEELARQFERSHNLTLHVSTPHHSQIITRSVNKVFRLPNSSTYTIQPTNPHEVRRHILSLKPRTAPGNDGISTVMLRHLSNHAIQHLTLLFNAVLQLGHFPNIWKSAKVVPIHKPNKHPSDANSYRPISLLSSISKLLERIIASRLASFVNQNHLLPATQFGFRKKHSTVSQLARIADHIPHGYNLRRHTGMALLDLEKA